MTQEWVTPFTTCSAELTFLPKVLVALNYKTDDNEKAGQKKSEYNFDTNRQCTFLQGFLFPNIFNTPKYNPPLTLTN